MIQPSQIRNIALVGHAGSGKTTIFEALLHTAGLTRTPGNIERGNTVSDHEPLEIQHGHSMQTSLASIERPDLRINLIDTPGYPDFRGPTLSALHAVETAVIVINASNGIEYGTRQMMHYARECHLPRVLVINHIDADDLNLPALINDIREEFGSECLPVQLPAEGGTQILDAFFQHEGKADFDRLADAHQRILDQVVEINERVMGRYLDQGEDALSREDLHNAFEQCLREGHLIPICFMSATTDVGVTEFLQLAERLLPNPAEGNPPPFERHHHGQVEPLHAVPDPALHVIADVFKIINDPFMGKLSVFRVYQGHIQHDSQLFIDDGHKSFKVSHVFRLQGKQTVEIQSAGPGDLAAVAKVDDIHFDAVLHDSHEEDEIRLAPLHFPKPMFSLAIEPARKGQEQKLSTALHRLTEEDPCFRVEHHRELNETVIQGLGALHLKVMLERMRERYGVEIVQHPPRIAYRETISTHAEGHYRHKKQTGGAGQFGEVYLRIDPLQRGQGFEFEVQIKGGVIPGQYLPAIEKGIHRALNEGALAGYPIEDLRVTVLDGKSHPVDSKEVAFVTAGRKAFLDAFAKASPQLLEPMVDLHVTIPDTRVGDITGNLASRRARILGTEASYRGESLIKAQAPLAELTDYATELKSMTAGQGRFVYEFSHYEPAPSTVQKNLSATWKPRAEED